MVWSMCNQLLLQQGVIHCMHWMNKLVVLMFYIYFLCLWTILHEAQNQRYIPEIVIFVKPCPKMYDRAKIKNDTKVYDNV